MHFTVHRPPGHRGFVRRGRWDGTDVHRVGLLETRRFAPPPPSPAQGIERPVARDRQYPGHQRAASGVVLVDVTPHLHEDVAHHFFRLVLVVQNVQYRAQDSRAQRSLERRLQSGGRACAGSCHLGAP